MPKNTFPTNCQFLYDLRTLTGFISGSDLHELFRKLVGDPSPKGNRVIEDLYRAFELCPELGSAMNDPAWLEKAKSYSGVEVTSYSPLRSGSIGELMFSLHVERTFRRLVAALEASV
jgi:hypothetical protein